MRRALSSPVVTVRSASLALALGVLGAGCASKPALQVPDGATVRVQNPQFSVPLPAGYEDATRELQRTAPELTMVLRSEKLSKGYQPTITIRKARLPGGTFAEPAACAEAGRGLTNGLDDDQAGAWTLLSASIIDGPVGRTCQIELKAPEGMSIITELFTPGNTRAAPKEVWLCTCNHAEGDDAAKALCQSTVAGFRFR